MHQDLLRRDMCITVHVAAIKQAIVTLTNWVFVQKVEQA